MTATVFYTSEDCGTETVLDWFGKQEAPGVKWNWQEQPLLEACKRSIGRNLAALATEADWVWFCDADYWFTSECWDEFTTIGSIEAALFFPRVVNTHRTHELGDMCIERALRTPGTVAADVKEFEPRVMRKAIGGIQIARGDVCRAQGYLRDSRRAQAPRKEAVFARNKEDVWFRRQLGTSGQAVALPGVYRIRHSKAGRYSPGLML